MSEPILDKALLIRRVSHTPLALSTERLVLDAFAPGDAAQIKTLAGDRDVSRMTAEIPHPYPIEAAHSWLATHAENKRRGTHATWAVRPGAAEPIIGCIGLVIAPADSVATLGYWLGKPYWKHGYTSEGCRAIMRWAHQVGIARVAATCLADNTASSRLLRGLGLAEEGRLRGHIVRDGHREDLLWFGAETSEIVSKLKQV